LTELHNGAVVSPEFRHGIVRRGHVQQCAHGGRSVRTREPRATSPCPVCARLTAAWVNWCMAVGNMLGRNPLEVVLS
jgi:hypothetical protein